MTDTTLINRAKVALEGWDRVKSDLENFDGDRRGHVAALTEYAEMLNGKTARDLARALIREREAAERLANAIEEWRDDGFAFSSHHAIQVGAALNKYREDQEGADDG